MEKQELERRTKKIRSYLNASGLESDFGVLQYITAENCQELLGDCSALNDDSAYGTYAFQEWDSESQGLVWKFRRGWHFLPDEAIILYGQTPPKSLYFGYTPYVVHKNFKPQSHPVDSSRLWDWFYHGYLFFHFGTALSQNLEKNLVFASIADTLNFLDIQERIGSAFNEEFALVTVANAQIKSQVEEALLESGLAPNRIFFQILPQKIHDGLSLKFGMEKDSDDFTVLNRVTHPEVMSELNRYISDPSVRVLRVIPKAETPVAPAFLPMTPLKIPQPSQKEGLELVRALDALESLVVGDQTNRGYQLQSTYLLEADAFNIYGDSGFSFLEQGKNTLGDTRDCQYSLTSFDFKLGCEKQKRAAFFHLRDDEFGLVIGVNHVASEADIYTHLVLYELKHHTPIASASSHQKSFGDSTRNYAHGAKRQVHPWLFTVKFDWNCTDAPGALCVPIQKPWGHNQQPPLILVQRDYVDPMTHTRPQGLVSSRFLVFRKK